MNEFDQSAADHWARFEAWENRRLREQPSDLFAALEWLSDAWDLASRLDPAWGSIESAEHDWRHHAEVQRALGRAFR